jgi:hypothetical protein
MTVMFLRERKRSVDVSPAAGAKSR